jgi:hypothetical protein
MRSNSEEEERAWYLFLEMLSVEHTEQFISELRLPIQPKEFPEVMRFARACLEVYMAPSRETRSGPFDAPEFPQYWQRYREKEGVLAEDLLSQYAKRYEDDRNVLFAMPGELEGWIGGDRASLLKDWFTRNYRPMNSGYQIWPHAFWELLRANSVGTSYPTPPPIESAQWGLVQAFCNDYDRQKKALGLRFREIDLEAQQSGPTPWEAALQTFPVDSSVGGSHPWLGTVMRCLELQLFRDCWRELRNQLGHEDMEHFMDWISKTANQHELPDSRAWLE